MEIGSKELVATKIPAPTNEERDKEKYWNKNCKTSKSEGFNDILAKHLYIIKT